MEVKLKAIQLCVAHAVTAKPRDFDQYEAPKDDKIEPKPRCPTRFATWLEQAGEERGEDDRLGTGT